MVGQCVPVAAPRLRLVQWQSALCGCVGVVVNAQRMKIDGQRQIERVGLCADDIDYIVPDAGRYPEIFPKVECGEQGSGISRRGRNVGKRYRPVTCCE